MLAGPFHFCQCVSCLYLSARTWKHRPASPRASDGMAHHAWVSTGLLGGTPEPVRNNMSVCGCVWERVRLMVGIKVEQEDAEWTFLLSPSHFSPPSACVILIVSVLLMRLWIFRFISKQVCLSVPALVHVTMFLCQMEHYGLQGTAVTTNSQVINIDRITDDLLPDSHETWGYEDISLQLPALTDRRCEIDWAMCWCFVLFFLLQPRKLRNSS